MTSTTTTPVEGTVLTTPDETPATETVVVETPAITTAPAPAPVIVSRPGPDRAAHLIQAGAEQTLTDDEMREWQMLSREERLASYRPHTQAQHEGEALTAYAVVLSGELHLSEPHAVELAASAIPPQAARGRYLTVWTEEHLDLLTQMRHARTTGHGSLMCTREKTRCSDAATMPWTGSGGRHVKHRTGALPMLAIIRTNAPLRSGAVERAVGGYQVKANDPTAWGPAGAKKPPRYLSPLGQPVDAQVDAASRAMLDGETAETQRRVYITEGVKKGDAAAIALVEPVIVLEGVTAHHATGYGSDLAPLLSDISWLGRLVTFAFDSDVIEKQPVQDGLRVLADALRAKGARVDYLRCDLAAGRVPGGKAGLDDLIDAGMDGDQLRGLTADTLPPVVQQTIATAAGGWTLPRPVATQKHLALSGLPQTWAEVVEAGQGWTLVDALAGCALIARLGEHAGLWEIKAEADDDGESRARYRQVTTWLAWRAGETRTLTGDTETGEPTYRVKLRLASGLAYGLDVDAKTSLDIKALQEASGAPIRLPDGVGDAGHVRTALAMLSADDREQTRTWQATGWAQVDGQAAFLAPAGSVTAVGIRTDLDVQRVGEAPEDATGWDRLPTTPAEHERGVRALVALLGLAPARPEIGLALLGALCSAPLPMAQHTTVLLQGERGSAKSIAAAMAYSAISSVGASSASLPVSIPRSTAKGILGSMRWHRHLVTVCDDYRRDAETEATRGNAAAGEKLGTILQTAYGQGGSKAADRSGRLRRGDVTPCTAAIVTAEVLPRSSAIIERAVTVTIAKGDVDTAEGGAVDTYRDAHAITGDARLGMAGLLADLADRLDNDYGGDLGRMGEQYEARRRDRMHWLWEEGADGRAGENVATLLVGWEALCEYAWRYCEADPIPLDADDLWPVMARQTASEHQAADPGERILEAVGDLLATGKGHLATTDMKPPADGIRHLIGWEQRGNDLVTRGPRLGYISPDGRHVLLMADALKVDAARAARLEGLDGRQVLEAVGRRCVPGTTPGGKPALGTYGIGSRQSIPRGYLVTVEAVGLGGDDSA